MQPEVKPCKAENMGSANTKVACRDSMHSLSQAETMNGTEILCISSVR